LEAATYDREGLLLLEKGDAAQALENYRKELEILTALPPPEQGAENTRRLFAVLYEHIGTALRAGGS